MAQESNDIRRCESFDRANRDIRNSSHCNPLTFTSLHQWNIAIGGNTRAGTLDSRACGHTSDGSGSGS
jgi:hypothetical protein